MPIDEVLKLLSVLTPLAWSPGPGNTYFCLLGARAGLRAAVPALAGYHVATFILVIVLALSLGELVSRHHALLAPLGRAAAAYMAYLAVHIWRHRRRPSGEAPLGVPATFLGGAALLTLNPKAYAIMAVVVSGFVTPGASTARLLAVAVVFSGNNLVAFVAWACLGVLIGRLPRRGTRGRVLEAGATSTALLAVAAWLGL